jgi:hypothetical protein
MAVMWQINTPWFDLSVLLAIFAVGNIVFGHFEEHRPKWRRLLKLAIFAGAFAALISSAGRGWAYGVLAIPLSAAVVIHAWWFPKHGINGWTGEPKDRYLELIRAKSRNT